LQAQRQQAERQQAAALEQGADQAHAFYQRLAPLGAQLTARGLLVNLSGENIRFPSGGAELPDEAGPTLTEIAEILLQQTDLKVQIEGHTDSSGNPRINQQLSTQRANAVRDALIERGISADRLSVTGRGSEAPIADNDNPVGRERNRRVELYLLRAPQADG
jgi:outer membrane protein OmpA-like peptidoglycan-associated protein